MAVKYRFEYTGVTGDEYKVDLANADYVSSVIDIEGAAIYGMADISETSNPLRSKYLNIKVLATIAVPLSDLFAANERYWTVKMYRDGSLLFFGYLTSEGVFQDYTTDKWYLEFQVLDPLAFLEDLAYVDLVGAAYSGLEETIVVVANALKRAFDDQTDAFDIIAYMPFDYQANSINYTAGAFPTDTNLDQDAWTDTDSGETKSCMEVLKDILGSLGLSVQQKNGDTWLIGHFLYDMLAIDGKYNNSFDKDGTGIADLGTTVFQSVNIITDNELGLNVMWCNKDQRYTYRRGLQELALDNVFIYRTAILSNPSFNGGILGGAMPGWTIDSATYGYSTASGNMRIYIQNIGETSRALAIYSETFEVDEYEGLLISGSFEANYTGGGISINALLDDGVNTYELSGTLDSGLVWRSTTATAKSNVKILAENGVLTDFELKIPSPNVQGALRIEMNAALNRDGHSEPDTTKYVELYDFNILGDESEINGLTSLGDRDGNTSLMTEKQEIFLSTGESETLANAIYKDTLEIPIELIYNIAKSGSPTTYMLLARSFLEDVLRVRNKRIVFSGSFFGFLDIDSFVKIVALSSSRFSITSYEFDTHNNIGSIVVEEINVSSFTWVYDLKEIYGSTIEPKIVS